MDCSVYCGIQCLLPRWLSGKEFACQRRRCRFDPRAEMIPWRGKWQPAVVYLPGKSYEQRSLAGCSPWGRKELETTGLTRTYQSPKRAWPSVLLAGASLERISWWRVPQRLPAFGVTLTGSQLTKEVKFSEAQLLCYWTGCRHMDLLRNNNFIIGIKILPLGLVWGGLILWKKGKRGVETTQHSGFIGILFKEFFSLAWSHVGHCTNRSWISLTLNKS